MTSETWDNWDRICMMWKVLLLIVKEIQVDLIPSINTSDIYDANNRLMHYNLFNEYL